MKCKINNIIDINIAITNCEIQSFKRFEEKLWTIKIHSVKNRWPCYENDTSEHMCVLNDAKLRNTQIHFKHI